MTTAPTTSPLESYQQGRDAILSVVLDAMTGLEGSVLAYQHTHEGLARAAGIELTAAQSENLRLQTLAGEQAEELEAARAHVCPTSEVDDVFVAIPAEAQTAEAPANADSPATESEGADHAAAASAAAAAIADLNGRLAAEQEISAGLRAELADAGKELELVQSALASATTRLEGAAESVRTLEATFDQKLQGRVDAAGAGIRGEAVRIIEAIAADNPNLAEAAELFAIAFPTEGPSVEPASATAPNALPAPVAAFSAPLAFSVPSAPPAPVENFFDSIPEDESRTDGRDDAAVPMIQTFNPSELGDDAILDPHFFDTPPTVDGHEAESPDAKDDPASPPAEQLDVPKPGYGLFGRKKEVQGA